MLTRTRRGRSYQQCGSLSASATTMTMPHIDEPSVASIVADLTALHIYRGKMEAVRDTRTCADVVCGH